MWKMPCLVQPCTRGLNGLKKIETRWKTMKRVKTMLIAFFDSKGLSPWICSVRPDSQCYISFECLATTCGHICRQYLLHNVKSHTTHIIQQYFTKNQITVLNYPLYSPDLAPPDFFLFLKVKLEMKGTFFQDVKVILATVTKHLKAIPIDEYVPSFES